MTTDTGKISYKEIIIGKYARVGELYEIRIPNGVSVSYNGAVKKVGSLYVSSEDLKKGCGELEKHEQIPAGTRANFPEGELIKIVQEAVRIAMERHELKKQLEKPLSKTEEKCAGYIDGDDGKDKEKD